MSQGRWTIPRSKQTPQVAHEDQPGIITVMRMDGEGNIKERMVCGETTDEEEGKWLGDQESNLGSKIQNLMNTIHLKSLLIITY